MTTKGDLTLTPELPIGMRRVEALQGKLPTRILNCVFQWSGFTQRQMVDLWKGSSPRIAGALEVLVEAELLTAVPVWVMCGGEVVSGKEPEDKDAILEQYDMYYGSDPATIYVTHRDRIMLDRTRARIHEDIRGDHNEDKPKILHTLHLHDCMVVLSRGGYRPSAGYRGSLYLSGGGQVVPDARMRMRADLGEYPTELVKGRFHSLNIRRAAETRKEIRTRLMEYVPAAREIPGLIVAVVCENKLLVDVVREEAGHLGVPAWAVSEAQVVLGEPLEGRAANLRPLYVDLDVYVEYERSATTPADIRDKLMKYVYAALAGFALTVLFICETEEAMLIFRQEHENLQREHSVGFSLITATYAEVMAGKKSGDTWNMDGQVVRLL